MAPLDRSSGRALLLAACMGLALGCGDEEPAPGGEATKAAADSIAADSAAHAAGAQEPT